jgi:hypothetical protein
MRMSAVATESVEEPLSADEPFRDTNCKSRNGRRPIGDRPMTAAERQQRRRAQGRDARTGAVSEQILGLSRLC